MFSFHLSFLTSLITNHIGLRLSLQALLEFRRLSSAGISQIYHSITNSLENVFWQIDVSKQHYSSSDHSHFFSVFLLKLPPSILLLTKKVIIHKLGYNKKILKSLETDHQTQSVPSLETRCCRREINIVRLGLYSLNSDLAEVKGRIPIDFNRVRILQFVNDFVKWKKELRLGFSKVPKEIRYFWDALEIPA